MEHDLIGTKKVNNYNVCKGAEGYQILVFSALLDKQRYNRERRLVKMARVLIFDSGDMDEMAVRDFIAFIKQRVGENLEQIEMPASFKRLDKLEFPGLQIRLKEQTVFLDGELISLSRYEFFTLCFLAGNPGWVFTKEQIYEAVWKEAGENCGTAVTNVISQIRRKLRQGSPTGGFIRTVIGMGYKFVSDCL